MINRVEYGPAAAGNGSVRSTVDSPDSLLAIRILGLISEVKDKGHVTAEHLLKLKRVGITLEALARSGALLIDGIEALGEKFPNGVLYEHGAALTAAERQMHAKEKVRSDGWVNQGGSEVHVGDNDVARALQPDDRKADIVHPVSFRIIGLSDINMGAGAIEDILLNGHLKWDIGRLQAAASLAGFARRGH